MGMTAETYLRQLQALLPDGTAWPKEADADITKTLHAIAEEFARIDSRADDLMEESDPYTVQELLPEWEGDAGLPDECIGELPTVEERRLALVGRLRQDGGQSPMFLVELAAVIGFTVTIDSFRPFTAGSSAGDYLTNGDWVHALRVNAPSVTVRDFVAGSRVGEPLRSWGNTVLECMINRVKHAHTIAIFAYS